MRRELTRRLFIACMIVFILGMGMVMFVTNTYLARRDLKEVKDTAHLVSAMLNAEGWEVLTGAEEHSDTRITIVAADGTVLYDSELPAEQMKNHAAREEIREALLTGEGGCERYSESLLRTTANYAVRLSDGNILRISMEQDSVWILLMVMLNAVAVVIGAAVLLSMFISAQFSKKIMEPINRMDVENPDDREIYDEMKPFIRRLMSQNQQIHRQMEELREEHSKQDAMRREFTANVSHELKTPLTSISGFAEIMRDGLVQEKDIPHFADNIHREAGRLIALVNDILKLSRLEDIDEGPDAESAPADLRETAEEVLARLRYQARKADIRLECTGEPVTILGTPILGEIVYNLCDNAIKYGRPGGWVRVETGLAEGRPFLRVSDNGIGIPAADQSRVFERFYRVNKSHSKEVGGTGLGLSIVKHGMAQLGGEIRLQSEEGAGTEVTLLFPAVNT